MMKRKYGITINIKKHISLMIGIFIGFCVSAQIPDGYYDSAEGLYESQLQQALHDIIDGHNELSYSDLWDAFYDTDPRPDNSSQVWDMYSDVPGGTASYYYTFGSDQCGNVGSNEGVCYNREHSWPKSWFGGEVSPMYTDLIHIVPTDGQVNGRRSNYAYGEVNNATWTSTNESKVGNSALSWTNETVFEPIDEYKGDFARIYFYMATRYKDEIDGWESNNTNADAMLNGTSYPVFEEGPLDMLMQWHQDDPVSQKEQIRNNAIYDWQGNRNPFVDRPEYVEYIWGDNPNVVNNSVLSTIKLWTAPAQDKLKISFYHHPQKTYDFVLYDICGKPVHSINTSEKSIDIDISGLQAGIYFLRVSDKNQKEQITRRVVLL